MFSAEYRRRRVLRILLLLFFFPSCSPPCAWEFHHAKGVAPCFYSEQILFRRQSNLDVIEIEILSDHHGMRMYLNLFLCPLQNGSGEQVAIKYGVTDSIEKESHAYLLEGGQRLLVSEKAACEIISFLLEGQTIFLEVGAYRMTLPPSNFPFVWEKLIRQFKSFDSYF